MADLKILGIFEDVAQRDFQTGLIRSYAAAAGHDVEIIPRLTKGCRFEFLAEHLELATEFHGVVIAVDGKKLAPAEKIKRLCRGVIRLGVELPDMPILWCVAIPSVEEWMMADSVALPATIAEVLGINVPNVERPGHPGAEITAKIRLRSWSEALAGRPLLRNGLEYAEEVGAKVDSSRIGERRNPDLKRLLQVNLPEFIEACCRRAE